MISRGYVGLSLIAAIAVVPSSAIAGTFQIPLPQLEQPVAEGDVPTSSFDLGTSFSHVESLTLGFVLPQGFELVAVTTGNSSYFSFLQVFVHADEELVAREFSGVVPPYPEFDNAFGKVVGDVNPDALTEVSFGRVAGLVDAGNPDPAGPDIVQIGSGPAWPDFVYSGRGHVTVRNIRQSFHHPLDPLQTGAVGSSTTSIGTPGEIRGAFLTLVGTPTPEPSSILLFAISFAGVGGRRHRGRQPR